MYRRKHSRAGFTMIELIVSMSVVGTLCAILAPAVQHGRSRVRDVECKNHLRQIGIALHNHEAAHKTFPTTGHYQVRLLEYLENRQDVWLCPADSRCSLGLGHDSYLLNDGTRFRLTERNGFAVQPFKLIPIQGRRDARPSDIQDGLSNTAAMSERLLVSGYSEASSEQELLADPVRFLWYVAARQPDEDSLADECQTARVTPYPLRYKTSGTWGDVGYDHILTPNLIGCQNGPASRFSIIGDQISSLVTATSEHGGYVNVLMCDGAVRHVSNSVDRATWRALGTRAGGEVLSLE